MASHPYYPTTLDIPLYVPNTRSTFELLVAAGSMMMILLISSVLLFNTSKKATSQARFSWFFVNGFMHCGFELYWLVNRKTLAGQNDLLAEMWKEYGHADSRYIAGTDNLLLTLETLTIFIWGPLCIASAYYILKGSYKQYSFQLFASMCHLFSCTLYYIVDLPEAINCNPSPVYFWVYFIGFNAPWILVSA
ncbi:3-beta-hydroxysteroid-Delta(8),Delta(7)-isomerase [Choanephora cucurbitarum]|uniref:3-beta-hydroxysteroid-Delta(8), Delta(7)-isomerase n=1 Tax=Choanephora cucurbitarum TaxID=101091 RepID=A0A1C7NP97_9FUNG|nr:3-beta-hydroxysteroid-Delta(8),Delta(7)-isomerase [Choanephora cucurbitarum]